MYSLLLTHIFEHFFLLKHQSFGWVFPLQFLELFPEFIFEILYILVLYFLQEIPNVVARDILFPVSFFFFPNFIGEKIIFFVFFFKEILILKIFFFFLFCLIILGTYWSKTMGFFVLFLFFLLFFSSFQSWSISFSLFYSLRSFHHWNYSWICLFLAFPIYDFEDFDFFLNIFYFHT